MKAQACPFSVLSRALRRTLCSHRVLAALWMISALATLLFALPVGLRLWGMLSNRPIGETLARGQADAVFLGEVLSMTGPLWTVGTAAVVVGGLFYWALLVTLSGGLIASLLPPGHPLRVGPGNLLSRAGATAGAMWRTEVWTLLVLRLPVVALVGGASALLSRGGILTGGTWNMLLLRLLPVGFGAALLWSIGTVLSNWTRLERLAQPAGGHSGWQALCLVLRRLRQGPWRSVLAIALCSLCAFCALIVGGRLAGAALDHALLVGPALLLRLGFSWARTVTTAWQLAAVGELFYQDHEKAGP